MINIHYYQATDVLGSWLSNMQPFKFEHDEHGSFLSIEGYWYWLQFPDDRLRDVYGAEAKRVGRIVRAEAKHVPVIKKGSPEFRRHICEAVTYKIANLEQLRERFLDNNEMFTHTGSYPGGVVDMAGTSQWWLDHINKLVTAKRVNKNVFDKYTISK